MRLLKITILFTLLSVALGFGASVSPRIAAAGWLLGTLLALAAGAVHGARAPTLRAALVGGLTAGGIPIFIGCGLGALFGPAPLTGLIAAVVVGLISGAAAAVLVRPITLGGARTLQLAANR